MALYHSAKGSVNYTIVGSPTIVDGVASGFSNSDYLASASNFPSGTLTSLEIQTKFNVADLANHTNQWAISIQTSNFVNDFGFANGTLWWLLGKDETNTTRQLYGHSIAEGDVVYAKGTIIDNVAQLYYSGDGKNWTLASSLDLGEHTITFASNKVRIGGAPYVETTKFFSGYIDLKETYIKVNGQPWFGVCPVEVKKHQLRGPVGYTVEGSPTITDGVASGFSDSNYLTLTSNLPTSGVKTLEVFVKFTPNTTSRQDILAQNNYYSQLGMWIDGGRRLYAIVYMGQGSPSYTEVQLSAITIQAGHTYYGKLTVSTETREISLSISEDKQNWTTATKTASRDIVIADTSYRIGKAGVGAFDGSIDLNETYIKVNGKLWYYQPAPTKYIIKDNSLVFADQGLYLTGPVNYTVVGNPTIVDGIANNFSANSYLVTNSNIPQNTTKLEIYAVFTTSSDISTEQMIWWVNGNPIAEYGGNYGVFFGFQINQANSHNFYMYANIDTQGVKYRYQHANFLVQANTTYALHAVLEGEAVEWELGEPGNLITQTPLRYGSPLSVLDQPLKMGHYDNDNTCYFKGLIDLNKSWIKVNDRLWFYGKNYATKNIAPIPAGYHTKGQVGCVAKGSPTITDGAVSGFSSDNFLTLNNVFNPGNYNWEFRTKVNPSFTGSASYIISRAAPTYRSGFGIALGTSLDTRAILNLSSSGSSNDIADGVRGAHNYYADTDYWIKLRFTGTQYILSYSLDDITYIDDITIDSSTSIYGANGFLAIGVNRYTTTGNIQPFGGSIDLNNTYIKVNNEMWFDGKGQYPFAGYVDMRTQAFTAAPSGATIGRDE